MNSDAESLYLLVLHLGRHLREVDREVGLSGVRFSILASLQFHGTANLAALAEDEKVSRPAITRLVKDMVKDGQVAIGPDPSDGRGVRVTITAAGKSQLLKSRRKKVSVIENYLSTLSVKERESLAPLVQKLAATVWPD